MGPCTWSHGPITSISNFKMLGGYRSIKFQKYAPCYRITSITNFKILGGYRPCTTYKISKCWEVMMKKCYENVQITSFTPNSLHILFYHCCCHKVNPSSNKALLFQPLHITFLHHLTTLTLCEPLARRYNSGI